MGNFGEGSMKRKLTSLLLHHLKPQAKAYIIWDTQQRGLAVRVEPTGYAAFKLIYRFHNRPRWYHIGAVDAIALADARQMAAKLMLEVLSGQDPATEKKIKRGAITFAALAQQYV